MPDSTPTAGREIITIRLIHAPRELVFAAWVDDKHIANWWGPVGFTTETKEKDVRPGGIWRFTMYGPDKTVYPNLVRYKTVVKPERLEYSHGTEEDPNMFQVTVTMEDRGANTLVTMRALFPSAEACEAVKRFGAVEGGMQTLDRLEGQMARQRGEFHLIRIFDAPRELVWQANTEEERLKHWWGPKGFTWVKCSLDLRPGGVFHYCMRSPDGKMEMWGKFVYREIVAPEKLSFVVSFSDATQGVTRHPWSATWPLEVLNTSEFVDIGGGKTKLIMHGVPGNATAEERQTFAAGFESMEKGFGGTMDQLAEYLKTAK